MKLDFHVYHHVLFDQGDPALPVFFVELEMRLMSALSDKLAALDAVANRLQARITELETLAANGGANQTDLDQLDASIARLEGLITPTSGPTPTPMPEPTPTPTPMPEPTPTPTPMPEPTPTPTPTPTPVPEPTPTPTPTPTPVPDPNAPIPSRPPS